MAIERISAVTLITRDMSRAVRFYLSLGFAVHEGGEDASFTTFSVGSAALNLSVEPARSPTPGWGRVIFHVADVDALYDRARAAGLSPSTRPADAAWGERYFHVLDPDGHELSFARLLAGDSPRPS